MAEQFYTILTKIGKAKIANATALGNKVNFTTLKVGDGKGKYYNPTEEQEDLVNEVWQGNINSIRVDENNPNWVVIEVIIPSSVGGFMIREAGVFDDENNMLAIGKYPETYKPQAQDGSTKDLVIRMMLEVSNTSSVTLKVDPTVILATQKDIQIINSNMVDLSERVSKNEENITSIKSDLADITAQQVENMGQINTSIEEIEKKITNYNSYASNKDSNGIYTVVEYKDKSNQLYMKSTLSSPDSNGNYKYDTWQFYKSGNVINTLKWTITYDADDNIVSKVVS
ncbi:phage tail protein [Clostridium sporogenes]|uniref:phage tail protein n=1 Tax=Clostridium sporogenes TaxID=1509 RepID=UPI001FA93BB9|nr:phage tail protein [Clostridium sporogenes]